MICARCGAPTDPSPCAACGADPLLDGRFRLDAAVGSRAWLSTLLYPNPRLGDDPTQPPEGVVIAAPPGELTLNRARLQLRLLRRTGDGHSPVHRGELVVSTPEGPVLHAVFPRPAGVAPAGLDEAQALALVRAGQRLFSVLHNLNPPLVVGEWAPGGLRWDGRTLSPLRLALGAEGEPQEDLRGLAALVRETLLQPPQEDGPLDQALATLERGTVTPLGEPLHLGVMGDDAPTALLRAARAMGEEEADKATEVMRREADTDGHADLDPLVETGQFPRPAAHLDPAPAAPPPRVAPPLARAAPPPRMEEDDTGPSRLALWLGLGLTALALGIVAALVLG